MKQEQQQLASFVLNRKRGWNKWGMSTKVPTKANLIQCHGHTIFFILRISLKEFTDFGNSILVYFGLRNSQRKFFSDLCVFIWGKEET